MSLTSELQNPHSVIMQFLNANCDGSMVKHIIEEHNAILGTAHIITPPPNSNLPLVGTSMIYAFRLQANPDLEWLTRSLAWRQVQHILETVKQQNYLRTVIFSAQTPEQKAFICLLMGCFEQVYRGTFAPELALLLTDKNLLRLPSQEIQQVDYTGSVLDITQLTDGFNLGWIDNFKQEKIYLNATFAGSRLVGGADAQMIIGNRLIDVRTTCRRFPFSKKDLYQQISYVLLDFENRWNLKEIVWVYPRQKMYLSYPISQLFANLSKVRKEFKKYLEASSSKLILRDRY